MNKCIHITYTNTINTMHIYNESNFIFVNQLGKGVFSQVNLFSNINDNKLYAVKRIKDDIENRYLKAGKNEIKIHNLFKNKSKFIIDFYGYYYCKNKLLHIVFEYMDYNLYEYQKKINKTMSIELIIKITYQICIAIEYLHQYIIHRDLKPENIMINKNTDIKVIDVGSSKILDTLKSYYNNQYIVSRYYRAPEIPYGLYYDTSIDIWSIACILFEMIFDYPLFAGRFEQDLIYKIAEHIGVPNLDSYKYSKKFNKFWVLKPNHQNNIIFNQSDYSQDVNSYDYEYRHTLKSEKIYYRIPRKTNFSSYLDEVLLDIDTNVTTIKYIKNFIMSIINYDSTQRPSATDCVNHLLFLEHKIKSNYSLA